MNDIEALIKMFDRAKIKYEVKQWKDEDGGSERLYLSLLRLEWGHYTKGMFFEFDYKTGNLITIDE